MWLLLVLVHEFWCFLCKVHFSWGVEADWGSMMHLRTGCYTVSGEKKGSLGERQDCRGSWTG